VIKTEIKPMTLSEIKHMLRFRLFFLLLTVFFPTLAVVFSFGKQLMHWPLTQSLLIAAVCVMLAMACLVEYLLLKRGLARKGL
jgi:hypothetical protein